MKKYLCISGVVLLACGGKSVDLGGNGSGWVSTNGTASTAAAPSSTAIKEPVTLYDGADQVEAIAVDETTIAAFISSVQRGGRIDLCQLSDCQGTQQTIRADSVLSNIYLMANPYWPVVLLSHGEVIWSESTQDLRMRIMACSTRGCPEGPRQIAETGGDFNVMASFTLAADSRAVYWVRQNSSAPGFMSSLMRCARTGCDLPTEWPLEEETEFPTGLAVSESTGMLYVSYNKRIAQIPSDFSSGLSRFYDGGSPLGGLALVGQDVYFAVGTLLGQIRRCSATGCGDGPELVANAPRWPHALVADEKQLYWFHVDTSNVFAEPLACVRTLESQRKTIASLDLVEGSEGVDLLSSVLRCSDCGLTMNSRFLFWCDPNASWSGFQIRMLQR